MGDLNTTPRTWVSGAKVLAAQMNTEVRDSITEMQSAADPYTPVLTGETTNPNLGTGGIVVGSYHRVGHFLVCWGLVKIGSSGFTIGAGRWVLTLPSGMTFLDTAGSGLGVAELNPANQNDVGVAGYIIPTAAGASTFFVMAPNTSTASVSQGVGGGTGHNATPGGIAFAAGGRIRWNFTTLIA